MSERIILERIDAILQEVTAKDQSISILVLYSSGLNIIALRCQCGKKCKAHQVLAEKRQKIYSLGKKIYTQIRSSLGWSTW